MVLGPEQTFSQRRCADGQKTHEKTGAHITHHQEIEARTRYCFACVRTAIIEKIGDDSC